MVDKVNIKLYSSYVFLFNLLLPRNRRLFVYMYMQFYQLRREPYHLPTYVSGEVAMIRVRLFARPHTCRRPHMYAGCAGAGQLEGTCAGLLFLSTH